MDSKALIRAKSHVTSKLKSTILSQCQHHLIATHNKNQTNENSNEAFSTQNMSEMFQKYPFSCDFPKPLLPPRKIQRDCRGREDSSMQLIYTKTKIQDDINRYLELYNKHSKGLNKYNNSDIKWTNENESEATKLPRYIAATAEILECDPDPHFNGNYNWYYSGGTLNNILYDMRNILIFPFADELIALPVQLKDDSVFKPDYKNAAKIPIDSNLFQLVYSTNNNHGRILTRHKNNCFLYNIFNMDKKKLLLIEVDKKPSDVPYVSVALDPFSINKYCTTNVDRNITIWDVTKAKRILNGNVPVTRFCEDSWAFIKYDDCKSDILKYIDRHCVHYYDTRLPIEQSVLSMCPYSNFEGCESISSYIASCKSEYYSYIGSTHSLGLLDSRSPNTGLVKKWTHLFKSSPLFSDVCFREDKEFIVIASQRSGETSIVLNDWNSNEESPESRCTPFTPPSIIETLNASQSQGKCLYPHLKNRLLLCNTGCMTTVDQQTGDIFLFTQNSINDIFYQGIAYPESLDIYSLENCKSLYKLKLWERQILKNSHSDINAPLVLTKKTGADSILKTFTNKKLKSTATDENEKNLECLYSWKKPVAELNSYVDIFAPMLLAHWEVAEDIPLVPITAAPHQKVLSWLGATENSQEIIASADTNNFKPPLVELEEPGITQDPNLFDTESVQQLFLPKVKSQTQSQHNKKNTKQSKFVPGF